MIARALLLLFIVVGLFITARLSPPPAPEVPTDTRWVKIGTQGEPLMAWDGPWGCVYDSEHSLLWEVKSDAEDLHDTQCSFSWYDGKTGVAKGGDCFGETRDTDTLDLIRYGNEGKRCGVTGWRLPTQAELRTLLIDNPRPGTPLIAQDYFPYTQKAPYWSSDAGRRLAGHFAHLHEGATAVDFQSGNSRNLPYSNAAFVRLVATALPFSTP